MSINKDNLVELVEEKGLTVDELMEHEFSAVSGPERSNVVLYDEWIEDAWLDDNGRWRFDWYLPELEGMIDEITELYNPWYDEDTETFYAEAMTWTHQGQFIHTENEKLGLWRFDINFQHDDLSYITGPAGLEHYLKTYFRPKVGDENEGYISEVSKLSDSEVEIEGYVTEFRYPLVNLNAMVDDILDTIEEHKEIYERQKEAFRKAAENEELEE